MMFVLEVHDVCVDSFVWADTHCLSGPGAGGDYSGGVGDYFSVGNGRWRWL